MEGNFEVLGFYGSILGPRRSLRQEVLLMKLKLYWGNKRKIEVPPIVLTLGTRRAGMFLEAQHCYLPRTCIHPCPWCLGCPHLNPPKGPILFSVVLESAGKSKLD